MIGILIVTHGDFAKGLKNAVELIAGRQEFFETIGLYHGDSIEKFYDNIGKKIDELEQGNGVLVFVDILGGSPSNTVLKLLKEKNIKAISGVNMPMVCHAVFSRLSNININELSIQCLDNGKNNQIELNNILENIEEVVEEDF